MHFDVFYLGKIDLKYLYTTFDCEYKMSFSFIPEFNTNPEWPNGGSPVMTAAAMPSSVITSSVVGGSHMVYPQGKEAEVDGMPEYGLQPSAASHHFKGPAGPMGMMVGGDGDHSKRHVS